jgi:uncharacterized protein with HEPN domain
MPRPSTLYLQDILQAIDAVRTDITDLDFDSFQSDQTLVRSVLFSLITIGEASGRLEKGIRARMPEIEWPAIAGFRNVIVHEYFGIDYETVWTIATDWLEPLRAACERVLNGLDDE